MTTESPIPFITLAADAERDRRYNLCKLCDRFDIANKTCLEDNAVMPVKTCWQDSTCPLSRWGVAEDTITE